LDWLRAAETVARTSLSIMQCSRSLKSSLKQRIASGCMFSSLRKRL